MKNIIFLIFMSITLTTNSMANYWWETEVPDYLNLSKLKNIEIIENIKYGSDIRQKFDVYISKRKLKNSPVLFLVHGGAWMSGDKSSTRMVLNKVNYWCQKGFVVVSTNYRFAPKVSITTQIQDIIQAVNKAQTIAHEWSADKNKFVLMGHSSGGHLISTIKESDLIIKPVAIIGIDVAGFDITAIMKEKHQKFYDIAFHNPAEWKNVSPQTNSSPFNFLLLCSFQSTLWCSQGERFSKSVILNGGTAQQLIFNLNHNSINETLGNPLYSSTLAVDEYFLKLKIINQ